MIIQLIGSSNYGYEINLFLDGMHYNIGVHFSLTDARLDTLTIKEFFQSTIPEIKIIEELKP